VQVFIPGGLGGQGAAELPIRYVTAILRCSQGKTQHGVLQTSHMSDRSKRDFSAAQADTPRRAECKKKRRPASVEMTGGASSSREASSRTLQEIGHFVRQAWPDRFEERFLRCVDRRVHPSRNLRGKQEVNAEEKTPVHFNSREPLPSRRFATLRARRVNGRNDE
jgi:hypothetical protein